VTPFVQTPLPIPEGETVRWSGAPCGGLILRASDAAAIPFTLLWCGFAIFWETSVVREGAPLFMVIWGVPFVLVGLYAVAGRFVWDAYVRARTRYAVTDRAAYIVVDGIGGGVRRFGGSALGDVRIAQKPDGSGTLRFAEGVPGMWSRRYPWQPSGAPAFEGIRDFDAAYAAVLAAQQGPGPAYPVPGGP
jgi:hypothetical protein